MRIRTLAQFYDLARRARDRARRARRSAIRHRGAVRGVPNRGATVHGETFDLFAA